MKRPSTGGARMSMAPGSSRTSMAPPRSGGLPRASVGGNFAESAGPSTASRNSMRKSFAPGSQPPPSARRSSQYGRPSMGAPANSNSFFASTQKAVQKDPRPLKSPQFRQKMQQEIQDYLLNNNYEMEMQIQLMPNTLVSPTQKDFYSMFQWLYCRLDPNYRFTAPKPETEVMPLLNNLRYPFATTITKTQLTAVGSANTWPSLLGMLYWMMELAMITDRYKSNAYDQAAEQEGVDISAQKYVFQYMAKCYNAWLAENDDHEEFEKELEAAFEERDAGLLEELRELQAGNIRRKRELETLDESHQPLKKLHEEKQVLEDDAKKYAAFIEHLDSKIKRHGEVIDKLRGEVVTLGEMREKTERLKADLQNKVDAQGLTPQDIDRMNNEREKLNQGLQQVSNKLTEAQNKLVEQEIAAQSKLEELERAASRYNKLAYQIGITPASAPKARGREYELQILPLADLEDARGESDKLTIDSRTGYQPSQILNVDLRHEVRPFLEQLRQEISGKIHSAVDDSMKHQELIDRVGEALTDKKDELDTLEAKVQAANNEYQELKEVCFGAIISNPDIS